MKIEDLKTVIDESGNSYRISKMIGQGGQGAVFRLEESGLAVKLLTDNDEVVEDEKIYELYREKITDVIILKDNDDIHICKPLIMLQKPMCGYVMHLLNELEPVSKMFYDMNSDESYDYVFTNTFGLLKRYEVLTELSRTLARLHSEGLVYCDLSANNVFYSNVNNFTKVWLIDCDNLAHSSEVRKTIFTPGYGAPEIISQTSYNTVFSDCYSFAVLAFRLLTNVDPFIGETEDRNIDDWDASTSVTINENEMHVNKFILDTHDQSILSKFSHLLTQSALDLFKKTFSEEALFNPTLRPSMREWYETLKSIRIQTTLCHNCESYIFDGETKCPICGEEQPIYPFGALSKLVMDYSSHVDSCLDSLDDITISENTRKELASLKKISTKKFKIYNDLTILSDNFETISIGKCPTNFLYFKQCDNGYYIYNLSGHQIIYKSQNEEKIIESGQSIYTISSKSFLFYKCKEEQFLYVLGVYLRADE